MLVWWMIRLSLFFKKQRPGKTAQDMNTAEINNKDDSLFETN
jgi:hypothetical protein